MPTFHLLALSFRDDIQIFETRDAIRILLSEALFHDSFNSIISFPVPLITVSPVDQKVKTGTSVSLPCDAEGNPEPNFFWSKDDNTLKYTNRIYLAADNKTLNIDHIKESDAAIYHCIAENILGSAEAPAKIEVINSHGPPVLVFEPYDLEAIPGTTIELPCGAEGNPPPLVSFALP